MTELAGWVPYRVRLDRGRVNWCYLGTDTFTDPFFEQTIERCMTRPFNQLFAHETPAGELIERSRESPGVAPAAFIFHCSRCGSTLFSQLAAALTGTVVISEAPPVDQILRAALPEDERIAWLRAMLGALGQRRRGDERHMIVKFDAWHVEQLPLIQRAFPAVPSVFLYRHPDEVMASQMRMPGMYMIPGMLSPSLIGLNDLESVLRLGREEYFARVLALVFTRGLEHVRAGRAVPMNYTELPDRAVKLLLKWCGIEDGSQIRERLQRVVASDAKTPSLPFDRSGVAEHASPAAAGAAHRLLDPVYEQLEAIRSPK